jgi:hypothetical protein
VLRVVARTARSGEVLPAVVDASAEGVDVVDGLSRFAAIGAGVVTEHLVGVLECYGITT